MIKVFIIDDCPSVNMTLKRLFEKENYKVKIFEHGYPAIDEVKRNPPDLIILDIGLPDISGLEVCKILKDDRLTESIPIIIVTGNDLNKDIVSGLWSGADDYLTKPFTNEELLARVNAVLRRVYYKGSTEEAIIIGAISLNISRQEVTVDNQPLALSNKEFDMLCLFMKNAGKVLSKIQILESVWGYTEYIDKRNVDVHVCNIRKKLGEEAAKRLKTVPNRGYQFLDY